MLSQAELNALKKVVDARLGNRSDGAALVDAYLIGVRRYAYERTAASAPVPTSLVAERAALLIEVSRELGRLIEDYEIQALLRLTPSSAASLRRTLLATYTDDADELLLAWTLRGARRGGRQKDGFAGTEVEFADKDRRDQFVALQKRNGVDVRVLHGDDERPFLVLVGDGFPKRKLPK